MKSKSDASKAIGAALVLCTTLSFAAVAHASPHNGSVDDSNIRYIGRWDHSVPGNAHSNWGGAYLRVRFTGSSIGVRAFDIMYQIDGGPYEQGHSLVGVTLKPGVHTLLLGSIGQNYEVDFEGLILDPGAVTLPVKKRPIIEFVGDSITTGGGQTVPPTVNYAWDTAEALGADHTQIAFSARALTTGFGCADDKAGLDNQYFKLENFNHLSDKTQRPWDFSYKPRIVVINLGQNDQCGQEPKQTFEESYVSFVQRIRAKLPNAHIVAVQPFSGAYADSVRDAVSLLTEGGVKGVSTISTAGWLAKSDFVDGIHPNQSGHAKVAAQLEPILKLILSARPNK